MPVVKNRRAYRDYEVIDEIEAGIQLTGSEVKSVRAARVDINQSYARLKEGEVFLINAHISPYQKARAEECEPRRERKLLLKKKEISYIAKSTERKGVTLVPTRIYFKRGWAKVSLGLARGKKKKDKRETIKRKTIEREMERERKKYI